jgi:hypothetical protein
VCQYGYCRQAGILFELSPSGDNWDFTQLWFLFHYGDWWYIDTFQTLAIDAGNGLHGVAQDIDYDGDCQGPMRLLCLWKSGIDFGNHRFNAWGPLGLDAQGNLYGTTFDCGKNNLGTVWELTTQ